MQGLRSLIRLTELDGFYKMFRGNHYGDTLVTLAWVYSKTYNVLEIIYAKIMKFSFVLPGFPRHTKVRLNIFLFMTSLLVNGFKIRLTDAAFHLRSLLFMLPPLWQYSYLFRGFLDFACGMTAGCRIY